MRFLAGPMGSILEMVYNIVGNYGLSIVIFTILVKLALLPLTIKQTRSMKKMQDIQPKLKELQTKYKDDKEKLNMKMLELYRENNVNPLGGCLPLLIQFPIIIGLFTALRDPAIYVFTPEYYEAMDTSFLWLPNLTDPDTFVFPLIAGVGTYLSSKTMSGGKSAQPGQMQQTQMMMTYMFPIMIFLMGSDLIFPGFPAGLSLYWAVNTTLQVIQQILINKTGEQTEIKGV